jgi:transcriptional regulator with XRE-family HTH domain
VQNETFSLSLHPNNKSERYARRKSPKNCAVEQKKTSKWLSEALGVNPSTVSKWCTNSSQPDIETLAKISKLLGVGVEDLFDKKFMESV